MTRISSNRFHWLALPVIAAAMLLPLACSDPGADRHAASAATQPATAPATTTAPHTPAKPRADLPGLPNFAQVSPVLYRGAQPTAEGFAQLKKMGVKTIINLRAMHSDRDELKGLGLRYAHFQSRPWNPEDQDTINFLKVVSDPANQPVFVHCAQGADRTGCAVAVYRMVEQGWTREEAIAEMPNFDFHSVWTEITEYLNDFDADATRKKLQNAPTPKVNTVP